MIEKRRFGEVYGKPVYEFIIRNTNGMTVSVLNYGAVIRSIVVSDRDGKFSDVVCGYDDIKSYIEGDGYQGAVVGRFANRIADGRFTLNGREYKLAKNDNGINSLHGGNDGLNKKLYAVTPYPASNALVLSTFLDDMEEGYPGRVFLEVRYTLTEDNALKIDYRAESDKDTIINITNHAYFNLGGYASGTVLGHKLWIDADTFLPTNAALIPIGEKRAVDSTPFDFRVEKTVGRDFYADYEPLKLAGGYDHCMNFVGGETKEPVHRATLSHDESGRVMKVYTNQPAVQLYSGNFMKNEKYPFKGGYPQHIQNALCLETQHMPDSINQKGFTDVVLNAGDIYSYTTIYAFETK